MYQFCNGDLNKFILLLRKGVYPYEYMNSWAKFDKTTIPPNEAFYSTLNLEDIGDEDYLHVQKVWGVFEMIYMFKVIHYSLQMCLKTLEMCALKYMNLILYILYLYSD